MDGSSYFPSRPEMEASLAAFAERTAIPVRYGCRWESTRRLDDGRFELTTTDGIYTTPTLIVAVGVAEPWRPDSPGIELVAHYADTRPVETYADKRVFIVGKQNSGFELASGLLSWARRIVIASPSPAKLSVNTHSLVGIRARYLQPYEDHVLGGGVGILDASIEAIERGPGGEGFVVRTRPSSGGPAMNFETDEVIAATGFVTPLRDLPELGVATFGQSRLPAQTPFWESATVPGIFFAGTIGQGSKGLQKHGIPANSGAVHGARYNARCLAGHIARTRFGIEPDRPSIAQRDLVDFVAAELTRGPEIWNQRAYLARFVAFDPAAGIRDDGIGPLAPFVDEAGPATLWRSPSRPTARAPSTRSSTVGSTAGSPSTGSTPIRCSTTTPRTHAARSSRSWPGSAPAFAEPEPLLETALVAGIAAGLGVAVPFGAIAVLIVETSIRRGRAFGWAAGAGAATADLTYATLAALFGTALADLIAPIQVPLRWVSVAVLVAIAGRGIAGAVRRARATPGEPGLERLDETSRRRTYLTFVGLTIVNPATVIYFAALILGLPSVGAGGAEKLAFVVGGRRRVVRLAAAHRHRRLAAPPPRLGPGDGGAQPGRLRDRPVHRDQHRARAPGRLIERRPAGCL